MRTRRARVARGRVRRRSPIFALLFFILRCAVLCVVLCAVVCAVGCVVGGRETPWGRAFRCVVVCVVVCAVSCAVGCVVRCSATAAGRQRLQPKSPAASADGRRTPEDRTAASADGRSSGDGNGTASGVDRTERRRLRGLCSVVVGGGSTLGLFGLGAWGGVFGWAEYRGTGRAQDPRGVQAGAPTGSGV